MPYKNIEKKRECGRKWYKRNKEHLKKYRKENREYHINYSRKYYQQNKEKFKRYNKEHREHIAKRKMEYRKNNPIARQKDRIRSATVRKYGRPPEGYQYHHYTEPYEVDKFIIVDIKDHKKIEEVEHASKDRP